MLYDGDETMLLGENIWAAPLSTLWGKRKLGQLLFHAETGLGGGEHNGHSSEFVLIDPQHYPRAWRVGSKSVASAPPIQDAQLFSVGRFHLGHPQSTRGAVQFYVCQPPPVLGAVLTPKSHIPPSLLTKLLQTLTLWHTQNAFHGNNLRVCRIRRFCYRLAEANHEVCVLSHTTL